MRQAGECARLSVCVCLYAECPCVLCMCADLCVRVCACMRARVQVRIHVRVSVCMCKRMCMYMQVRVHVCVFVRAYFCGVSQQTSWPLKTVLYARWLRFACWRKGAMVGCCGCDTVLLVVHDCSAATVHACARVCFGVFLQKFLYTCVLLYPWIEKWIEK